jgi:hypothetical protein
MLSETTIARWKQPALARSLKLVRAPSRLLFYLLPGLRDTELTSAALPSEISIRTACRLNSAIDVGKVFRNNSESDSCTPIASIILDAVQRSTHVLFEQEARAIFNDLQQLLESRSDPIKVEFEKQRLEICEWRAEMEPDLFQIRNLMNLQSRLSLGPELDGKLDQILCATNVLICAFSFISLGHQ